MGARERFEQAADYINSLYSGLEDSIFKLIINALKDGDYQHVDQSDVVMWQAQQLQKIGRLNQDAVKLMAQVDGLSEDAVKDLIKFHGMQIIDEIDGQLEQATKQSQPLSVDVTNKLDALADQTWTDLQNNVNESLVTRNYQQSAITKAYRQILTESTMTTVSGATSHEDAVKHALYKVVDQGLPTRLIDKAGHNWSIDGYVRMVTTTTVNRTYNDLRLQRMKDFDMHLALMSSHPNSRPACAWIQGHVVNLVPPESDDYDPKYDSIYNHDYGKPSGTLGINCRHILFPYVPGMNTNHQPQYDPKEAIKNGKLVQGQRARERAIRDAKKRLKVAEELGDTEMVSRTKTLIRARQAKLRDYIKETNAGHKVPILTREYDRERIFFKPTKVIKGESGAINKDAESFTKFVPVLKGDEEAKKLYIEFAQRDTRSMAKKIAKIDGFSYEDGLEIYHHIFIDKHLSIDPATNKKIQAKFEPDAEMAQSFQRIFNGQKLLPKDIILLKHERYERKLMKQHPDLDYYSAHHLTNKIYNYEEFDKKRRTKDK